MVTWTQFQRTSSDLCILHKTCVLYHHPSFLSLCSHLAQLHSSHSWRKCDFFPTPDLTPHFLQGFIFLTINLSPTCMCNPYLGTVSIPRLCFDYAPVLFSCSIYSAVSVPSSSLKVFSHCGTGQISDWVLFPDLISSPASLFLKFQKIGFRSPPQTYILKPLPK